MNKVKDFFIKNEWLVVVLFTALFVLIRLPGTNLPLHQDEYKWPMIVNPNFVSETEIPHPPLSQFIYRVGGQIVGFNTNFRFIPLFFGTLNLILLYYFVRENYGKRNALIASCIWIFSYFSVLASLMVDTDGEIMPFFFLLSLISYFKFIKYEGNKKYLWGIFLIIFSILGFFIKVSFLLATLAIAMDYIWSKRHYLDKKTILKYTSFLISGVLLLFVLLYIAQRVFSFFDLSTAFEYWKHFLVADRGWFQTLIQCVKALLYSSPFLILVPFMASKNSLSKVRVFLFFIFNAFVFYILLFDFSIGALDRYLELLILPLSVIVSVVISGVFEGDSRRFREFFYLGLIVGLVLVLAQSVPHYVPALHPKTDWINRMLSFKWNFLYPFSGGSGPLGFYMSFLFMGISWFITFVVVIFSKFKPDYKKMILMFLIPIGFSYNLLFIEEYLVGYFNGHAPKLLEESVEYIKNNPDIKMVTVYNDNGGNEIKEIGKYRKRLYVDPKFDINEKIKTLNQYKEHYFVLDVPRIDPTSIYAKYFDSCRVDYMKKDKYITSTIYDCRGVSDIKI